MEIVILVLVAAALALVVLAAKRGAEAAQREREQRWGGFSGIRSEPSERAAGSPAGGAGAILPGTTAPSPRHTPGVPRAAPRGDVQLPPPDRPQPAATVADAGRQVLRAFRRSEDQPAPASASGQAVGVADRSPAYSAATGVRRQEGTRRPAGSAPQGTTTARHPRSSASPALRRRPATVDINRAAVDELQSLPGVGIRAAERIVAYRERNGDFAAVGDLARVEGFDQHRVSRLAQRATV